MSNTDLIILFFVVVALVAGIFLLVHFNYPTAGAVVFLILGVGAMLAPSENKEKPPK